MTRSSLRFRYVLFVWLAGLVFMFGLTEGFGGTLPSQIEKAFDVPIANIDVGAFLAWLVWRVIAALTVRGAR